MKKSITENITTSKLSQQRTNARNHKVEFLSLREDISEALEKGWSITVIWETLRDEGCFTATYNTFRLYILKYLNGQKSGLSRNLVEHRAMQLVEKLPMKKQLTPISSFTFSPKRNPEDLF
jgi:hypothetical protein